MSDWEEALRTLLERATTVNDLTSLDAFFDVRTQIRDEIFARVSTKEEKLKELGAAHDDEIAGFHEELRAQREEFAKQLELERERSKEALQLAESKYAELKKFVNVLRKSNTEAAERMCRELQAVREKVVRDTEQAERTEADRRVREQKAIIERLRIRLNNCENEEAQEREKYAQDSQEVCAKHETQIKDICESAHKILAQRLQKAEKGATEEIQRMKSRCEDLEQQLRDTHLLHKQRSSEAQEKEKKWRESFSKVKHLKCVQEAFQDVVRAREARRSISMEKSPLESPKSRMSARSVASRTKTAVSPERASEWFPTSKASSLVGVPSSGPRSGATTKPSSGPPGSNRNPHTSGVLSGGGSAAGARAGVHCPRASSLGVRRGLMVEQGPRDERDGARNGKYEYVNRDAQKMKFHKLLYR